MSGAPSLTDRASFLFWSQEQVRYGDTDRQGHVNNAVFATFCESGRVALLHQDGGRIAPVGTEFVIARLAIDFRAELHWPAEVAIGSRVQRFGRHSLTIGQGLFHGETCVATAESVVVLIGQQSRRPVALPPALHASLVLFADP